ncbi:hypothetical protein BHM03_00008011 [Ensete ventricosum]|nr:hypothetical protein BHM03_00008011 [Ensete ventricosum]
MIPLGPLSNTTPHLPMTQWSDACPLPVPRSIACSTQNTTPLSSNSTDSLRAQLHLMNQRIDDVQKDVIRSKEGLRESFTGGSPFILEVQDKLIPKHFRLPMLEAYDSSSDPMEHIAAFRAQMALYGNSDAIMCRAFLTTL